MRLTARMTIAALALSAPLLTGCGGGSDEPKASAVATAGAATGDVLVYGSVRREGDAVDRAEVVIQLTSPSDMEQAEVGESIPIWTAARTRTDADGDFVIRLAADDVPTKYFVSRDRSLLNFEVNVVAGNDWTMWGSTVAAVDDPHVWRSDETAVAADSAARFQFDLGTKRLTITDSFGEKEKSELTVRESSGLSFYQ